MDIGSSGLLQADGGAQVWATLEILLRQNL
jgi:hypothetical protein